jgi:hypothetical protein
VSDEAAEGFIILYCLAWIAIGLGAWIVWGWRGLGFTVLAFGVITLGLTLIKLSGRD